MDIEILVRLPPGSPIANMIWCAVKTIFLPLSVATKNSFGGFFMGLAVDKIDNASTIKLLNLIGQGRKIILHNWPQEYSNTKKFNIEYAYQKEAIQGGKNRDTKQN